MKEITLFVAFSAGLLSFLSPCLLPLVPLYLSYISGLSIDELSCAESKKKALRRVLVSTIFFVLGFSSFFLLLGVGATWISSLILGHQRILNLILGIVIIIFGLHRLGVFKIGFLAVEKRFYLKKVPENFLGPFLLGFLLFLGWMPCIGPILGTILSVAATKEQFMDGLILLGFYSLGLSLPFILTSIALSRFLSSLEKIKRYFRLISVISGTIIIGVGILMTTGYRF